MSTNGFPVLAGEQRKNRRFHCECKGKAGSHYPLIPCVNVKNRGQSDSPAVSLPDMKLYIISDIHLGGQAGKREAEKRQQLYAFFRHVAAEKATLVLLGDLFDLWFEYKHAIPKEHAETIGQLFALREAGVEVHFILGNHDFWIGDFFARELGFHVYADPIDLEFARHRFHFHHGDGIASWDWGYRLLKRVFRFRPNIFLYRWLHPDIGLPLAKSISSSSRKYTSKRELQRDPDYIAYARQHIAAGSDYVLMGHRHQPEREAIDKGIYINTGDWTFHQTYAEFDGHQLLLKCWPSQTQYPSEKT
jgi:UDP-2,3-diacylglucosamine hydrolase